jgi:ankyrin repeat protein
MGILIPCCCCCCCCRKATISYLDLKDPVKVKAFLDRGGNPNLEAVEFPHYHQVCGYRTILHWAAFFKNIESCKLLVNAGADKSARDVRGKRPVDIAADMNADKELIDFLRPI